MSLEFNLISSDEYCTYIGDGTHGTHKNQEKGKYLLSAKDILDGSVHIKEDSRIISEEDFNKIHKNFKLDDYDVLLTVAGTIGRTALITNYKGNYTFQRSVAIFKTDEKIKSLWLYYYLNTPIAKQIIKSLAKGTTQLVLPLNDLRKLEIPVPTNKEYQKKILSILVDIDKKIELNKEINQNLVELINIIFNYWFLQFDFPNLNNKPYAAYAGEMKYYEELKREIPINWKIGSLEDIAEYVNGLPCQKHRPIDEHKKLPVIKITEMHDGITDKTEFVRDDIDEKHIINDGDILFSWSATLETMLWAGGKGGLNQHIFKVIPKDYGKYYVYMMLSAYIVNFVRMAESRKTTMGHITKDHLLQSKIPLPPKELTYEFDKLVSPLFDKYIQNNIEIRELKSLKEFLLPLLMNGRVDFK